MSNKREDFLESENKRLSQAYNSIVKKHNEMMQALQTAAQENAQLRALSNELANAFGYLLAMTAGGRLNLSFETLKSLQGNSNYKVWIDADAEKNRIYETEPTRKKRLQEEGIDGEITPTADGGRIVLATSIPKGDQLPKKGNLHLIKP